MRANIRYPNTQDLFKNSSIPPVHFQGINISKHKSQIRLCWSFVLHPKSEQIARHFWKPWRS